jgi:hypothetical protein
MPAPTTTAALPPPPEVAPTLRHASEANRVLLTGILDAHHASGDLVVATSTRLAGEPVAGLRVRGIPVIVSGMSLGGFGR